MTAHGPTIDNWRLILRKGFLPQLSLKSLWALWEALRKDDARLLQGATCTPPTLQVVQDWPVEAGCLVGYAGAIENGGFKDDYIGLQDSVASKRRAFVFSSSTVTPAAAMPPQLLGFAPNAAAVEYLRKSRRFIATSSLRGAGCATKQSLPGAAGFFGPLFLAGAMCVADFGSGGI